MENSLRLALPFIQASQAQKHLPHNAAIQMLDQITQLSVLSRSFSQAPSAPNEGDQYIIPDNHSWPANTGQIAIYEGAGWIYLTPRNGWQAWDQETQSLLVFSAGTWINAIRQGIESHDFGQKDFYIQMAQNLQSYYFTLAQSTAAQKCGLVLSGQSGAQAIWELDDSGRLRLTGNDGNGVYMEHLGVNLMGGCLDFPSLPRISATCNYDLNLGAAQAQQVVLNEAALNPVMMHDASEGHIVIRSSGTYHIGYTITLNSSGASGGLIESAILANDNTLDQTKAFTKIDQSASAQIQAQTVLELYENDIITLEVKPSVEGINIPNKNAHVSIYKIA